MTAEGILNGAGALVEPAEAERAVGDVPLSVIDLGEADLFPAERLLTLTQWVHQRMPPFWLTRRTS